MLISGGVVFFLFIKGIQAYINRRFPRIAQKSLGVIGQLPFELSFRFGIALLIN